MVFPPGVGGAGFPTVVENMGGAWVNTWGEHGGS